MNIKDKIRVSTDYKQNYSDLLKSPKWQRRRLEVMQRDAWKCKSCGDEESELHVHHLQYTADKPWDEPDDNLITLCDSCHKAIHYLIKCDFAGMETFIPICRLMDELESASINKFLKSQTNG